jgi:hypothetical protein
LAQAAIDKDDLNSGRLELIQQQGLVRIAARQSIRRMHIQTVDTSCGNQISQPLERWTNQRRATVAFVQELAFGR